MKVSRREQLIALGMRCRKFIVTVLGFVATAAASATDGHIVPEKYMPWVVLFLGVCTSYGVYQIKNVHPEPTPEPVPEPQVVEQPEPTLPMEYPTGA